MYNSSALLDTTPLILVGFLGNLGVAVWFDEDRLHLLLEKVAEYSASRSTYPRK